MRPSLLGWGRQLFNLLSQAKLVGTDTDMCGSSERVQRMYLNSEGSKSYHPAKALLSASRQISVPIPYCN